MSNQETWREIIPKMKEAADSLKAEAATPKDTQLKSQAQGLAEELLDFYARLADLKLRLTWVPQTLADRAIEAEKKAESDASKAEAAAKRAENAAERAEAHARKEKQS